MWSQPDPLIDNQSIPYSICRKIGIIVKHENIEYHVSSLVSFLSYETIFFCQKISFHFIIAVWSYFKDKYWSQVTGSQSKCQLLNVFSIFLFYDFQGSDPRAATCRGKLQTKRSKLNMQINKELMLRSGAENLFK